MLEPRLFSEVNEYLQEQIKLNDAKLEVLNQDSEDFEIFVEKSQFQAGIHIQRHLNDKEYIVPFKVEG